VDATLIAQAPRLAPHVEGMRHNLANRLQLPLDRVSVKATTPDHLGAIGRKEGIAAQAVALLGRLPGAGQQPAD
jgi:2-C-methyl-D-erythritol 2,4-cyclodiphosphate synthase